MSIYALDKFLNNVFDVYAVPGISTDFTYNKEEYYVSSNDKEWIIEIPLPGMTKENLKINFEDNMLTIEAISSIKSKAIRNIKKSWALDDSVDITLTTAKLENGLLTVVLPKIKSSKKNISINIF